MIAKIRTIKLKKLLVGFLLLSLLSPTKNIATNHDRKGDTNYAITSFNANIPNENSWLASTNHVVLRTNPHTLYNISRMLNKHSKLGNCRFIYSLLFIIGSIYTSLYNYFTGHNKIKNGWYHGKFFVYFGKKTKFYFGKKTNITKNFHEDLYFSLLNFCANLFECLFITRDLLLLILKTISYDINIRIYKNFYFCFNLMSLIRIGILHNRRSLLHSAITECLLWILSQNNHTEINLPKNFNLSNIHCWKPQEHTHFNTNNII